jgi:hypothetical protein
MEKNTEVNSSNCNKLQFLMKVKSAFFCLSSSYLRIALMLVSCVLCGGLVRFLVRIIGGEVDLGSKWTNIVVKTTLSRSPGVKNIKITWQHHGEVFEGFGGQIIFLVKIL